MATKHDMIIQYIESLPIGEKISVRGIAKHLKMSEGTAYRAIKDAEHIGIVSTIERVGTIRIEKKYHHLPDILTYSEVLNMIEGTILGGESGLTRHLAKFMIGAMTPEAMLRYFSDDSLLIVGNREDVQLFALEHGVAVLITGGFAASEAVIRLANERSLPVISTTFDTFTVATLINRTMADQVIKREIMTIQDIYIPQQQIPELTPTDTIEDYLKIVDQIGISTLPVSYNNRLIGVISTSDVQNKAEYLPLDRVMTKDPVTVKTHMSVASVSHKMLWQDIQMIPVVEDNLQLVGIVTRQDVSKALQVVQQSPQMVNTFEEEIVASLTPVEQEENPYLFSISVPPRMVNHFGTISFGVLSEMVAYAASQHVQKMIGSNIVIEKMDLNYFNLIQIGNDIQVKAEIFNANRRSAHVQVDVFHENSLVAKAIVTAQMIDRK